MIRSFIYVVFFAVVALFQSCTTEDNTINTNKDASFDALVLSQSIQGFPEKVPADARPLSLALEENVSWHDYHEFYKFDLQSHENEPFYKNLQWITIANLIREEDFSTTATESIRLFYLEEMMARDFINEPEVAAILLYQLSSEISRGMLAEYAREIIRLNESHFTSRDNFLAHKSRHENAYVQLYALGFDRWGGNL